MPTAPAKSADEIADSVKELIDRLIDARFTQDMTKRGQEVAGVLAARGADVEKMAAEAWRDSRPARKDAAKRLARATDDAAKWSDRAWRRSIRPTLKELFKGRNAALGVAGAAVPAGRELVDTAAVRLGIKQREERHWGMFFLGLLIGAAAGAVVALLTAPKRGSEMRRELGERADEVRHEIAEKAKEAEWVPMFQREGAGNGHAQEAADAFADASGNVQEGAAATGEAAEAAATDAAEAINEAYESVDRESPA